MGCCFFLRMCVMQFQNVSFPPKAVRRVASPLGLAFRIAARDNLIEAGNPSPNVSSSIRGRFALYWIFIGSMFNASCLIRVE